MFIFHSCHFSLPVPVWNVSILQHVREKYQQGSCWCEKHCYGLLFSSTRAGLWDLGKELHGRTWENVCGSLCIETLMCWKVLVTMEKVNIAEDLLRLPSCSTSPFNRALTSSDGWWPWWKKDKLQLAFAGSCKLQYYVPSHLIACSPAQSLPTSCSQHFVGEKGYILTSCGDECRLCRKAVWFWSLNSAM